MALLLYYMQLPNHDIFFFFVWSRDKYWDTLPKLTELTREGQLNLLGGGLRFYSPRGSDIHWLETRGLSGAVGKSVIHLINHLSIGY